MQTSDLLDSLSLDHLSSMGVAMDQAVLDAPILIIHTDTVSQNVIIFNACVSSTLKGYRDVIFVSNYGTCLIHTASNDNLRLHLYKDIPSVHGRFLRFLQGKGGKVKVRTQRIGI